ncbi:MAG: hypothetical protein H6648_06470 [Caldilineae bacterium]|nr:hypothetical protein [Chloroflexota bacterium]MCB9176789.1 hypothetical protein [Caldilineae bacterium]
MSGSSKNPFEGHPDLATWLGLSVGFLVLLAWSARGLGLGVQAWLVLALAATSVAGLCTRIIAWEADPEAHEADAPPHARGDAP